MNKKTKITPLLTKILTILAISILIALPASNVYPLSIALLLGGITGLLIILLFMFNEFFLIPRYFFLRKRIKFIILNASFLIGLSLFHYLLDKLLIQPHNLIEEHSSPPALFLIIRSMFLFLMANFISITLYLSGTVKEQAIREKNLKEEKLGTELELLKAQINPHFIFNALNNIYALTYTQSEKAPESVLKLSEMLRYVFYDCSKDTVKLKDEIAYIDNFISFHQMKSAHQQKITFDYSNAYPGYTISPMLFIPFIENAFKYSKIEELPEAFVEIYLSTNNEKIYFQIKNTVPETGKPNPGKGLGINNVRQRLEVLYPGKHSLKIDEKDFIFTVTLQIQKT